MKIRINLRCTYIDLPISKVTEIHTEKEMINLDKLNDGTWRLIYSRNTIDDLSAVKSFEIVRD